MKLTTSLFAIIITANAFGQEIKKDTPTADFKRVQVGANFSPDYCFRMLKNNDGSSISEDILKSRNSNESPKLGYSAGLNLIFNLREKIGIEIGVQYSNKGYQIKMDDLTFASMIDPRHGFVYNTSGPKPTKVKFIYNDNYLDIPLKVNFIFGKRKIRFITSAGATTNIFIKATTTGVIEYADGSHTRKTQSSSVDYNKLNISPFISTGINWKLNSRNNLRFEPTFRYGVLKIIDAPVTGYLWNAGLNIGYYFGL